MTSNSLSFVKSLEGVWVGPGRGVFPPDIPEFFYTEELTIKQGAKPVIFELRSITRRADNGAPMHIEVGFIRCPLNQDTAELVASHPFGLSEICHGGINKSGELELHCNEANILRTSSSSGVRTTGLRRIYRMDPESGKLNFEMDMATDKHPELQNHLISTLTRKM
jgi:hypothetical protein